MAPDFTSVCRHIYTRLARELSPHLTYHSLFHTRHDVLPAAYRLARQQQLDAEDCLAVLTAALFHDTGFLLSYRDHEHYSVLIARETLPRYGYSPAQIETIAAIIAATRMPQRPRDVLQEIMCDADLDLLGRDDFMELNRRLLNETLHFSNQPLSIASWFVDQSRFLESHRFFTLAASTTHAAGKAKNLTLLRAALGSSAKPPPAAGLAGV